MSENANIEAMEKARDEFMKRETIFDEPTYDPKRRVELVAHRNLVKGFEAGYKAQSERIAVLEAALRNAYKHLSDIYDTSDEDATMHSALVGVELIAAALEGK